MPQDQLTTTLPRPENYTKINTGLGGEGEREDMPSSSLKVISHRPPCPVPLHWYHRREPWADKSSGTGRSLSSWAFSEAKDHHYTGHTSYLNPPGVVQGLPLPTPQRGGKPVIAAPHKQPLREPGQREAQRKHQEGHTTVQSHRDHDQPSQDPQSLGQGPPELGRQYTHTFGRGC